MRLWRPGAGGVIVVIAASRGLAGCGASVAGKNMSGIWFNEPFIGGWSEQEVADKHCAQYGLHAVYAGELLRGNAYSSPVRAYDCQ